MLLNIKLKYAPPVLFWLFKPEPILSRLVVFNLSIDTEDILIWN